MVKFYGLKTNRWFERPHWSNSKFLATTFPSAEDVACADAFNKICIHSHILKPVISQTLFDINTNANINLQLEYLNCTFT